MAKWQRCHNGVMDVGKQSKMDDCKQNNKHKIKGRINKSHNRGGGRTTYKREYKVKMDDVQC